MNRSATQTILASALFTGERVLRPGWVSIEGARILAVGDGTPPSGVRHDLDDALLTPGLIDLHCHGGGGAAFTEGADAARTAIATHLARGTTSMMASLVTDAPDRLADQIGCLAPLDDEELLGVHLEGPWLSERQRGAHAADLLRDPSAAELARLMRPQLAMVTLAPECTGGLEAVRWLADRGVIAALGHTDATYDQARASIEAGVRVATHLYNAERPPHHREPGPVLAALESEEVVVELIADGVHLHPAVLADAARRAAGGWVLVTDAMAAAGAGDGTFRLGPRQVEVRGGVARAADGAIAGSTLTLDRAVAYAVRVAGIGLDEAIAAATRTPAAVLGRDDIGRLREGAYADMVVFDPDLSVRRVMRRGRWIA